MLCIPRGEVKRLLAIEGLLAIFIEVDRSIRSNSPLQLRRYRFRSPADRCLFRLFGANVSICRNFFLPLDLQRPKFSLKHGGQKFAASDRCRVE